MRVTRESGIFQMPDDIMLNHILSNLDTKSLFRLFETHRKLKLICSNIHFWKTKIQQLPFFNNIPTNAQEAIKEYRTIVEANNLANNFADKLYHRILKINGSLDDKLKILKEVSIEKTVGGLCIEDITKISLSFIISIAKEFIVSMALIHSNVWKYYTIKLDKIGFIGLLGKVIYNIKRPTF